MPIYVFECNNGHKFDLFLKLEDYNSPQTCSCGEKAKRKIVPTMISCDIQPWDYYESPVSGKPITSYKARKEDMARHDCVDYDPGMKDMQKSRIKNEEKALEKSLDETVEREWSKMSTDKKESLSKELLSGADVEIERL